MRKLRNEQEIMQHWKGNPQQPLVSICCITYNHEPYIEDTLEGFLIQETDFPFEILIHDDASTDRTADIIREYEKQYPNLIKPIYQVENQYSQGKSPTQEFNFPRIKGKYVALCEGDDYWLVPLKLQKQVSFLEEDEGYSACGHKFKKLKDGVLVSTNSIAIKNSFTLYDLVWNIPFQTATIVFKKDSLVIPPKSSLRLTDTSTFMLLAEHGDIYFMNEYMSVYRIHEGGVWSGRTPLQRIELREHYQKQRMEYFKDGNLRIAKALQFKLSQDYISTMAISLQRFEIINTILCFVRSFKYSYGIAQIKQLQTLIKLFWKKITRKK